MVYTNLLEPYPAEISQREPQYMRLRESHYFYSPYPTETQKTSFKLASSNIESFTKLAPFTNKGTTIQFGPYENIAPFSVSAIPACASQPSVLDLSFPSNTRSPRL